MVATKKNNSNLYIVEFTTSFTFRYGKFVLG